MTHLLIAVVLAASYPPAPPPEKSLGLAPNILVATVAKDKLLVQRTVYVPTAKEVTLMVRVGDKIELRKNLVTVMVPNTEETAYELSKVTAFDGAGKALDAKTLAERLKKPAPVVISADGQPVDAQYLELLKPETTVLVIAGLNPVHVGGGVPVGPNPNPNPNVNPNPRPMPPLPPPEKVPPPKGAPNIIGDVAAEEPKSEEPKGKEVKFETHAGHFEKKSSGLKGDTSFLVITDAKSFRDVFGIARTMGPKLNFVADGAFDAKVVLATIQRGNKAVTYKVDKVTDDDGVLTIAYTSTPGKESTATFHSPLIVSVDKGNYKSVVFLENGKKAGTADFPKEK
jgi:hypothetical protein